MNECLHDDPEREQKLNEVLLAYVEEAEAGRHPDRQRLLAQYPDFRTELEEFFASHDEVDRLASPVRRAAREPAMVRAGSTAGKESTLQPTPDIGQLGDFRLLREVGRGGMGVVYEAEQISLRRRVALKVLPFAAAIDPRQLQRFKNEAMAAAHLRHESIVPVFAVGQERGVHYYAMQFIEGQSLASLIAGLRRLAGEPQPITAESTGPYLGSGADETSLTEADRLATESFSRERSMHSRRYFRRIAELGRQAALALEHAHHSGIIHRDIKPANLLLDPRGQLWVTDFGLAQVTGDTGLTATGEMLGTLRYASPEQALGRRGLLDHRSDIYSLGATLYELLTLRPIFDGRDRHELLRQIGEDEPQLPRLLNRAVPVELETIVLKAVAKEPGDRYATAQELADDLQRFLEDRPILARRPGLFERAARWSRRHWGIVVTGATLLVLLALGSAISLALVARANIKLKAAQKDTKDALAREKQRAREADEQRARAEKSFQKARAAVDMLAQVGEELSNGPRSSEARRRLLETAFMYYRDFIEDRRADPASRADLAAARERVGAILRELAASASYWRVKFLTDQLTEPDVRKDLGLPEQPASSAMAAKDFEWEQFSERWKALQKLDADGRSKGLQELTRAAETRLDNLLTPAQRQRLQQIALQKRGLRALLETEVASELGLSTAQKARIRTLLNEAFRTSPRPEPGHPPTDQDRAARDAFWKAVNGRVLNVLMDSQRTRWTAMLGRPFEGKAAPDFHRGRRGPKPWGRDGGMPPP